MWRFNAIQRQFIAAGVSFLLIAALTTLLCEYLLFTPPLAYSLTLLFSIFFNFFLLRRFVFQIQHGNACMQFLGYFPSVFAFRLVEYGLFYALLTIMGIHYMVSVILVQGLMFTIKFFYVGGIIFKLPVRTLISMPKSVRLEEVVRGGIEAAGAGADVGTGMVPDQCPQGRENAMRKDGQDQPLSEQDRAHKESDKELFDRISTSYCRKDLAWAGRYARRQRLRSTLDAVKAEAPPSILEIGCGAGFSADYLQGRYTSFQGVDQSAELISVARSRHAANANVQFTTADIDTFQPSASFDLILMIGVLHHLPNPVDSLARMKTWLNPGGWIVANEPQSSNPVLTLLRRIRSRIDNAYSTDQVQYSPDDLSTLFRDAGFADTRLRYQGVFSTPFAEVACSPSILFLVPAVAVVLVDRVLERFFQRYLSAVSWNCIAASQAGWHESRLHTQVGTHGETWRCGTTLRF